MSYTSTYTGKQIDDAIAEVSTIKTNIGNIQNDISTINNTTIKNINNQINTLSAQLNNLNNSLEINFVNYPIYNQQIAEINNTFQNLQNNLSILDAAIQSKVSLEAYTAAIDELIASDNNLKDLIADGDYQLLIACQQLTNANANEITNVNSKVDSNTQNINLINTNITEIDNKITTINNTTIPELNSKIVTIENDYITESELSTKETEILNSVSGSYATINQLETLSNDISTTYTTNMTVEELLTNYVTLTTYEAKIKNLESTIKSLQERLTQVENKINNSNNEGWPS